MTKQLLIGILATFLTLGFFGTALAGESIADRDVYQFDAPMTKADEAAMNYQYDQDALSRVGTELGNSEFRFDAPETRADIAARNYNYDQERLDNVGTEAGNWEYSFDNDASSGTMCSTC